MSDFQCVPCDLTRPGECEIVGEFTCSSCDDLHRRIVVVPLDLTPAAMREADIGSIVELRINPASLEDLIAIMKQARVEMVDTSDDLGDVAGHA